MLTPIHSFTVTVEKRRGDEEPVFVGAANWTINDMPSRQTFFAIVGSFYEKIELPYFPYRVWAEVALRDRFETVEVAEAVDNPQKVAQELWTKITELSKPQ